MAPLVRTGGSRHTGLAAPPHRNIQKRTMIQKKMIIMIRKKIRKTRVYG